MVAVAVAFNDVMAPRQGQSCGGARVDGIPVQVEDLDRGVVGRLDRDRVGLSKQPPAAAGCYLNFADAGIERLGQESGGGTKRRRESDPRRPPKQDTHNSPY